MPKHLNGVTLFIISLEDLLVYVQKDVFAHLGITFLFIMHSLYVIMLLYQDNEGFIHSQGTGSRVRDDTKQQAS